jgi:hypothetical protein
MCPEHMGGPVGPSPHTWENQEKDWKSARNSDHPHLRGENAKLLTKMTSRTGPSPRVWGKPWIPNDLHTKNVKEQAKRTNPFPHESERETYTITRIMR